MIIGHNKNLDFLQKAVRENTLANVYCFFGPEEVGKKTTAFELSGELLGRERTKLLSHPDFLFLEREFDEKTGKTKKDISVEQIGKATAFLKSKPWLGEKKVLVLDGAQYLNSSSANAFLKTLEEPGENNFIFLIAPEDKNIPSTVLSRSQKINFSLVNDDELENYLKENSVSEEINEILYWSWGRPGRMMKILNQENFLADLKKEKERWQKISTLPFYEKLKEVEDIFGSPKGDHIKSREYLIEILDIWTMLWRELFLGLNNKKEKDVLKIFDTIKETRELLQKNVHPRLLIERLLLIF